MDEALTIRAAMGADVTPIAGGTDLVVAMNRSGAGPDHFLDLTRIDGYAEVSRDNGTWRLGGGATFSSLSRLPVRALAEAAMTVGGPAIRNRGTIAGNLGTASPAGDGCVALLAMDAEVEMAHATRGTRTIPIEDYFTGFRQTALLANELITGVRFSADWQTAWYKIGKRGSINISLVCAAVARSPRGELRIAFGCVAPTVIRAKSAETLIQRDGLTDGAIDAAAEAAMAEVSPIDDHRASAAYRRAMCGVLTRRLLRAIRDEAATAGNRNNDRQASNYQGPTRSAATPAQTSADAPGDGRLKCRINGAAVEVEVDPYETVLDVLRDRLGLTGTKGSCLEGECGSCTVLLDGEAVNSCLVPALQARGRAVETVEGLADGDKLHVLQEAFLAAGAAQCGYCTPGLLVAAKTLLDKNPDPTQEEFFQGMEGNLCRCTGYASICEAIRSAARQWRDGS